MTPAGEREALLLRHCRNRGWNPKKLTVLQANEIYGSPKWRQLTRQMQLTAVAERNRATGRSKRFN